MTDLELLSPYFTFNELACKGSNKVVLAPGFAQKLLELRLAFNKPMHINSACRSKEYNAKVGGVPKSLHVYDEPFYPTGGCCAVDIGNLTPLNRTDLTILAWSLGWSIGSHPVFLHLDCRKFFAGLPQITFPY